MLDLNVERESIYWASIHTELRIDSLGHLVLSNQSLTPYLSFPFSP